MLILTKQTIRQARLSSQFNTWHFKRVCLGVPSVRVGVDARLGQIAHLACLVWVNILSWGFRYEKRDPFSYALLQKSLQIESVQSLAWFEVILQLEDRYSRTGRNDDWFRDSV